MALPTARLHASFLEVSDQVQVKKRVAKTVVELSAKPFSQGAPGSMDTDPEPKA